VSTAPCHLGGIGVLVTRPADQADPLCELIEAAHGRPIRFPTLEIAATPDPDAARAILALPCDLLVFVSANAVRHAFALLPQELPADIAIAAVGKATASRLADVGLEPSIVPADGFDSESLLALPELQQVAGRRVVIVRGNDGRPVLGDALRERGAEVAYAEVYERRLPRRSTANLVRGWDQLVQVVTATSNTILDNLFELLGAEGGDLLRRTPLLVVSRRMADHARTRGCRRVYLAASAHDDDLLEALCAMDASYG
jgi:uroporphyrinogen-III synthase